MIDSQPTAVQPQKVLGGLLLAALVATVYAPAYQAGFFWDDRMWLWENPVINYGQGWWRYFISPDTPDYFPISSLSFYIQWQLFGREPLGYHMVSVIQHALACIVLWRVFVQLRLSETTALAGAALFAVHPLAVSSVCWITEQKNTLSMLLYVASLWCYLQHDQTRKTRWYISAAAIFILGLLCKTSGIVLPLVYLAAIWFRHGRINRRDALRIAPFLMISLVLGLVTICFQNAGLPQHIAARPEGLASRVAGAGWIVWFYLYKMIWPTPLMMIYPRWSVDGFSLQAHLPWLAALLLLIILWRKHRAACVTTSILILILAPILGLITMSMHEFSLVADHWVYPALPVAVGGAAALIAMLIKSQRATFITFIVIVAALSVLSFRHAKLFRTEESIWTDNIRKNSACWSAYNDLGLIVGRAGDNQQALAYLNKAIELNPKFVKAYNNLGKRLYDMGRTQDAIMQLQIAIKLYPEYARAHSNLGSIFAKQNNLLEARKHLRTAVDLEPRNTGALSNLAAIHLKLEHFKLAEILSRKALAFNSNFSSARINLALSLQSQELYEQAAIELNIVVREQPNNAQLCNRLGMMYAQSGQLYKAIEQFEATLNIDPTDKDAQYNLKHARSLIKEMSP